VRDAGREAEVNQLGDGFGLVEKNVLQFDVSMRHVALMAVVDSLDYLSPQELGLKLRHLSIWLHLEIAMQAATVDIFHDQEDLLGRFKCLVELRDVGMVQLLHNLHLPLDALLPVGLDQL
jgi:hypothetical protein